MKVFTLVLGIWLFPKVSTLRCRECLPGVSGTCSETIKECPLQDHQCGSVRVVSYVGQSKLLDMNMKTCALAKECFEGSVNFGISKSAFSSKCCKTDLCNSQPAPDISKSSPNGKKCFSCDGDTCTNTVNCEGNEDHCLKATVKVGGQDVTMKGCASELICSGAIDAQLARSIGTDISCCQGNLCNSASSASAGLLLLVVPLISSVVFS